MEGPTNMDGMSPEELEQMRTDLVAQFDAADAEGDVDKMQAVAAQLDEINAKISSSAPVAASGETATAVAPETESADPIAPAEAAPTEAAPAAADGAAPAAEPVEAAPAAAPTEATPAAPAATEAAPAATEAAPAAAPEATPEAAPAADENKETTVEVTDIDVPEENQPTVASGPNYVIRAGGDIPGLTAGSELKNMDDINNAMVKKINALRNISAGGDPVVVASITRSDDFVDEEKMLRPGDSEGNARKIRNFYRETEGSVDAMVAAGWCAPKTPLYEVPGLGTTATPVADSMASFGVERGGIIWQEPPGLGGVDWTNFGRWENTADEGDPETWQFVPGITGQANPVDNKPCVDIPCGNESSAELIAIPLCLCFDIMSTRANPEMTKANTDLVMIAQSRFTEQYLLANMFGHPAVTNQEALAGGNKTIGQPDVPLGIVRDWLIGLRVAAGQFRWRNRLPKDFTLRLYAPSWLVDAMAADLMVQMPGDSTMSTGYSEISGFLGEINVDPVWYMDDMPVVGTGAAATTAASNFDSMMGWPQVAEWMLTVPGAFTRLDGGSLDLGVVRTKEDVQKNKYCEFAETFEAVAYMGPSASDGAWAVRGSTPVLIRGGFTPAVALADVTAAGGGVIDEGFDPNA